MINPFLEINWKPDRAAMLDFGKALVIGGGILLTIASIYRIGICPSRAAKSMQIVFCVIIICGFSALLFPTLTKPVYFVWFFVGACIGIVVANLLFSVFFYLFFTPIAMIVRFSGRDPLRLRPPDGPSYWVDHDTPKDPKRYYRQY